MGSSLVFSIEQNLCRAMSEETERKLPITPVYKHGFLRVSVKELFLSAQAANGDRGVATQRAMTLD